MQYADKRPWGRPASSNPGAARDAASAAPRPGYRDGGEPSSPRLHLGWVSVDSPQGPKRAGRIERRGDELWFVREVDERTHLLRRLDAYGTDLRLLRRLCDLGVRMAELRERGSKTVRRTRLEYWLRVGVVEDFRHGEQCFLARSLFTILPGPSVGTACGD